ncbi:M23 family metallopeptidase, partial [Enterococcus entomosocium]
YAADAGKVVVSGFFASYGNYVVLEHANGLFTGYAHNSSNAVSVGQTVTRGQQVGNMGSTGDSTGPHLHFQFMRNGPWPSSNDDFINPREYINF